MPDMERGSQYSPEIKNTPKLVLEVLPPSPSEYGNLEVIDLKKIDSVKAVSYKKGYSTIIEITNEKGEKFRAQIGLSSHDFAKSIGTSNSFLPTPKSTKDIQSRMNTFLAGKRCNTNAFQEIIEDWYKLSNEYLLVKAGDDNNIDKKDVLSKNPFYFMDGTIWDIYIKEDTSGERVFVFTNGERAMLVDPQKPSVSKPINLDDLKKLRDLNSVLVTDNGIKVAESGNTLTLSNDNGDRLASFGGRSACLDPDEADRLYFIQAGGIYSLDSKGAATRSSFPVPMDKINIPNPQELKIDPHGNFLIIRNNENNLYFVEKETGQIVQTINGVKGPVTIDERGDVMFIDDKNQLSEVQTNFQAIAPGSVGLSEEKRAEELKSLQERFSSLDLQRVNKQKGEQISEADVANTLRETISRQVSDAIRTASNAESVEEILDRLQGLKADPANNAYQEVVDEFVTQARDKLSLIKTTELEFKLGEFEGALQGVQTVGDTIGLDEQFSHLLEMRQKVDIADLGKRRELERKITALQSQKETLLARYQGELESAIQSSLPAIEQLIRECGSMQELGLLNTTLESQQLEMMLANIRDPQKRREFRDRVSQVKTEQKAKLESQSREIEEQQRLRWAQIIDETKEDLESMQEEVSKLADSKEVDRFGRHPLVTAWRAKLYALPPELREHEEKRLEILLSSRKKDLEHRKDLGAVGESGELKFGNATFPVYKEPPRLWQPKFLSRKNGLEGWADLIFEDSQGRVWKPEGESPIIVNADLNDEKTKRLIERYRKEADEYFRGLKRRVPEFDEHWRITDYHKEKLEEVAEALNLQIANHRGILILQGEAGTGKNVLVDILANLSNREVIQIACNENTVKEDLTYEFYYDPDKGTYKLPSRLIEGLQTPGTIILWDEINALKPGIAKMMNSLFDYRRRILLPEGGKQREIMVDPSVIFIGTMNPQNYAGVNRLSPEVKSRSRVVDIEYPPFEVVTNRTRYRSDEAEMLSAYMDVLSELKQAEFKRVWDYVINRDTSNGADTILKDDPQMETDVRRIYDVVRVANRLREMYEAWQTGDSTEPMDFPTSLREVTDIVMEMNHKKGVKKMIKRVIIPKIDDRRQKKIVEETIDSVLPTIEEKSLEGFIKSAGSIL